MFQLAITGPEQLVEQIKKHFSDGCLAGGYRAGDRLVQQKVFHNPLDLSAIRPRIFGECNQQIKGELIRPTTVLQNSDEVSAVEAVKNATIRICIDTEFIVATCFSRNLFIAPLNNASKVEDGQVLFIFYNQTHKGKLRIIGKFEDFVLLNLQYPENILIHPIVTAQQLDRASIMGRNIVSIEPRLVRIKRATVKIVSKQYIILNRQVRFGSIIFDKVQGIGIVSKSRKKSIVWENLGRFSLLLSQPDRYLVRSTILPGVGLYILSVGSADALGRQIQPGVVIKLVYDQAELFRAMACRTRIFEIRFGLFDGILREGFVEYRFG